METIMIKNEEFEGVLQVLKLDGCCYVYIGDAGCEFNSMELILPPKYEPRPKVAHVWGQEGQVPVMIQKLCKMFGMIAFSINCALPGSVLPILEAEITRLMSN